MLSFFYPKKGLSMKKMEYMLYHDIGNIKTFTNYDDTDPQKEMMNYIKRGKYNSTVADLIIPMISRALKVRIIILHNLGLIIQLIWNHNEVFPIKLQVNSLNPFILQCHMNNHRNL